MFLLILLFIIVPVAELYVIIQIGGAIGMGPTVAILLADSILGAVLLRSQGRDAWVRFNRALSESRMPHREVMDGVLIIFGGALLLTPGFITDVLGLILLIPPTRAGVRAFFSRVVLARLSMGPRAAMWGYGRVRERGGRPRPAPGPGSAAAGGPPGGDPFGWPDSPFPGRPPARGGQPGDIEGTAHEVREGDQLPAADDEPPER